MRKIDDTDPFIDRQPYKIAVFNLRQKHSNFEYGENAEISKSEKLENCFFTAKDKWGAEYKYMGERIKGTNQRHGRGKCIWDNSMYEGWWFRDQRVGIGREISGEGFIYSGSWEQDLKKGFGTLTWKTKYRDQT